MYLNAGMREGFAQLKKVPVSVPARKTGQIGHSLPPGPDIQPAFSHRQVMCSQTTSRSVLEPCPPVVDLPYFNPS